MKHDFSKAYIHKLSVHQVGNKFLGKDTILSNELLEINDDVKTSLEKYFFLSFISETYYRFTHSADKQLNEVYSFISEIFSNRESLHTNSIHLVNHLFEQSNHPNIKVGEFYTVYFKDCLFDGKQINAIGLFKTEKKDTFLKVKQEKSTFNISNETGVNIKNLDKGCLIFDLEADDGYWVSIVDKSNKGDEAKYWKNQFLGLELRENDFSQTKNFLTMYKGFVTEHLPNEKAISTVEQATLLNNSINFFQNEDVFDRKEFSHNVFEDEEQVEIFDSYIDEKYSNSWESFEISEIAVKKQTKNFKKHIRLDDSFDILIRSNEHKIEKGEDEKGQFYKIYFNEEK